MAHWWEHSTPINVARIRVPDRVLYVGWVCWFLHLFRGFFSRFSSFPPSSKTNTSKFQFDRESEGHRFVSHKTIMCNRPRSLPERKARKKTANMSSGLVSHFYSPLSIIKPLCELRLIQSKHRTQLQAGCHLNKWIVQVWVWTISPLIEPSVVKLQTISEKM